MKAPSKVAKTKPAFESLVRLDLRQQGKIPYLPLEKNKCSRLTALIVKGSVGDEGLYVDVAHTVQQQTQVLCRQSLQWWRWDHVKHPHLDVLHTHTQRKLSLSWSLPLFRGFWTRMVYLHYITCLRYTILGRNPRFVSTVTILVTVFKVIILNISFGIHEDGMWLPSRLDEKTVTYAKISPKMVNARDKAEEWEEEGQCGKSHHHSRHHW